MSIILLAAAILPVMFVWKHRRIRVARGRVYAWPSDGRVTP